MQAKKIVHEKVQQMLTLEDFDNLLRFNFNLSATAATDLEHSFACFRTSSASFSFIFKLLDKVDVSSSSLVFTSSVVSLHALSSSIPLLLIEF